MNAADLLIGVQDDRPAMVGMPADGPRQGGPGRVGSERHPPAMAAVRVMTSPQAGAFVAADRFDRNGIVGWDVGVVDEREVWDRVIGPQPVRQRTVCVQRHRIAPLSPYAVDIYSIHV
jgi:hypothetical protein